MARARFVWVTALLAPAACASPGVNAGEAGGVAWIGMSIMLIVTGIVLYLFIGRDE